MVLPPLPYDSCKVNQKGWSSISFLFSKKIKKVKRYQKTQDSWRPNTDRKHRKTVRSTNPDGTPSGTRRQESIVRKGHLLLMVGRQESVPDGSSCQELPSGNLLLAAKKNVAIDILKIHHLYIHQDTEYIDEQIISLYTNLPKYKEFCMTTCFTYSSQIQRSTHSNSKALQLAL